MLRQSSLTFGEAKIRVAESTGSESNSERLAKAGESIRAAFRHWNNAANWKWLRTVKSDYTTVQGTTDYTLPTLIKSVHSVLITSSTPRALDFIDRRYLNKALPNHTIQNPPAFYDLFTTESGTGVMRLYPIPSQAETFELDYYRRMVLPCTVTGAAALTLGFDTVNITSGTWSGISLGAPVSVTAAAPLASGQVVASISSATTFVMDLPADDSISTTTVTVGGDNVLLDCPEEYTEGIIAWATHHYLMNKAGAPRLEYWGAYAQQELDKALRENNKDTPDAELCLLPPYAWETPQLSPNDIRWADLGW